MERAENDPISVPATLSGPNSRAWRLDDRLTHAAIVGAWLIEAPRAHPIWHSYLLSMAHLREHPNMPEPIIHLPGATHELVVLALDPGQPRQDMFDGGLFYDLIPANFAAQLICEDDTVAQSRLRAAVDQVVSGALSPDSDARAAWIALFGDNMIRR